MIEIGTPSGLGDRTYARQREDTKDGKDAESKPAFLLPVVLGSEEMRSKDLVCSGLARQSAEILSRQAGPKTKFI